MKLHQFIERHTWLLWLSLVLCLLMVFVLNIAIGPVNIPLSTVLHAFLSSSKNIDSTIILSIRLPIALSGIIVGASLGVSGAIFQAILRNPLADPYILGISAGAALGASIAQALLLSSIPVSLSAFVGAIAAMAMVYLLSLSSGSSTPLYLILSGVAISALLGSIMSFVMLMSNAMQIRIYSIMLWLMGGIKETGWHELIFIGAAFSVLMVLALLTAPYLDILPFGDEKASSLGVHVERARLLSMTIAALLAGIAVYLSGLVGFVGLVVPHITRLVIGPSHKRLITVSIFVGAIFLLFSDLIARTVLRPIEVPVGIITSLIGAPFFLYLLLRAYKGYKF
ncbi:MAG: iron ABC transporter permease [Deltaproteobacteria bacterium]|nr:iron ABC transporter permease [Deltaproteobacteria bacterium]